MHIPATLTPTEFEQHVHRWLATVSGGLNEFQVTRLETVTGAGGDYEIDVVARFTALGGADFVVLVECKHHHNPIKREVIQVLESKLRDVKAHKGMVFSTARFQAGALEFAKMHGIATVLVSDAGTQYQTRSFGDRPLPTPGEAIACLCTPTASGYEATRVDRFHPELLAPWTRP
ncbi:restriction endonuclease [Burkholderiaceae bacterium UC74_6]